MLENLLLFSLICHSFYYFYNHTARGTFTLAKYLPLHICNLSVYLLIAVFLGFKFERTWKHRFTTLVYYWSLFPAFFGFYFPRFAKPRTLEFWIYRIFLKSFFDCHELFLFTNFCGFSSQIQVCAFFGLYFIGFWANFCFAAQPSSWLQL